MGSQHTNSIRWVVNDATVAAVAVLVAVLVALVVAVLVAVLVAFVAAVFFPSTPGDREIMLQIFIHSSLPYLSAVIIITILTRNEKTSGVKNCVFLLGH